MLRILKKLSIRIKLFVSFLLLASFILILGLTAISFQKKITENQEKRLTNIKVSNAFFEGKYFLRSDMHIFTELMQATNQGELNPWWGEHNLQIDFFNDQLQKIEEEFTLNKNINNDTIQKELFVIITNIKQIFNNEFIPLFDKLYKNKINEIEITRNTNDSTINTDAFSLLLGRQKSYKAINKDVTRIGLDIIKIIDKGKSLEQVSNSRIKCQGSLLIKRTRNIFITLTILGIIFSFFVALSTYKLIALPVNRIIQHLTLLKNGEQPKESEVLLEDEFGLIQKSLNSLTQYLIKTSSFSKDIRKGDFESEFQPMSENDILGNSLVQMRDSLKKAKNDEEKRKIEDKNRAWTTNGVAKFGDIMNQNGQNLHDLGYNIISNLIEYLDAAQGALFVINEDNNEDVFYELISAVAYNRSRLLEKKIRIGEGLVGRIAHEKKTIYLTEIPENYVNITSGLGKANPTAILLIPVKLEDEVNGVIELISFKKFSDMQIDFMEKIGENIGSFIASIKTNKKTAYLLAESRQKSEELASQEEEMRQNIEELQATQEDATRREVEQNTLWSTLGEMVGIVETDFKGNITSANKKACNILEINENELLGSNYKSTFLSVEDLDTEDIWNKIQQKNKLSLELKWNTSEKSKRITHDISFIEDIHGHLKKILFLIKIT